MIPYALKVPETEVIPITEAISFIGADKLHEQGIKGKGVTVAVIDTGANLNHPMLKGAIKKAISVVPKETPEDGHGHGSWCASAIAGRPTNVTYNGNKYTLYGVAPEADLIVIKVLSNEGTGQQSWIMEGMEIAYEEGADIVSMSLGSLWDAGGMSPDSRVLNELALKYNVIFTVAAGNSFFPFTLGSPGSAIGAITCASVAMRQPTPGAVSSFSSKGPVSTGLMKPNVAGPGGNILAPGIAELILAAGKGGTYVPMAGTCVIGDTFVKGGIREEVPIKNLKIGDKIMSVKGDDKVLNFISQGKNMVYELETEDGRIVRATNEHRFLVKDGGFFVWRDLKYLKVGDEIAVC